LNLPVDSTKYKMIGHGFSPPGERSDIDSVYNTNIEIITRNSGRGDIIDAWEKLEKTLFNL